MKKSLALFATVLAAVLNAATPSTSLVYKETANSAITGDLTFPSGKTLTLNGTLAGTPAGGTLNLSAVTLTPPSNIVTLTGTQTLTNKTLTSPTLTTPSIGAATGTSLSLTGAATSNNAFLVDTNTSFVSHTATAGKLQAQTSWGGVISGFGTTNDVSIFNKSGGLALSVPTGTTNVGIAGTLLIPDGTTAAPSLTFAADTNTGIARAATDSLEITAGGTRSALFTSTGQTVSGNLTVNGTGTHTFSGNIIADKASGASILKARQNTDTTSYSSFDAQGDTGSLSGYRLNSSYASSGVFQAGSSLIDSSGTNADLYINTNRTLYLATNGTVRNTITSTGTTLGGNLTVSGTGTSSVAGKLAVGATSTSYKVDVNGSLVSTYTNNPALALLRSTDSQAANKGGGLLFGGVYSGTDQTEFAYIGGVKENGTDGNYAGKLVFGTRGNGTSSEDMTRMTLTSGGNFLVGSTTDSTLAKLQVASNLHLNTADPTLYWNSNFLDLRSSTESVGVIRIRPNSSGTAYNPRLEIQNTSGTTTINLEGTGNATFAGTVKIANTAEIKGVRTATATYDFGTIASGDASGVCSVSISGVVGTETVIVNATDADHFPQFCTLNAVPGTNVVTVRLYNGTASSKTIGSRSFRVTVISF